MTETRTVKACTTHGCNDPHYAWTECPDCKRLQAEVERLQADYDEAVALLAGICHGCNQRWPMASPPEDATQWRPTHVWPGEGLWTCSLSEAARIFLAKQEKGDSE